MSYAKFFSRKKPTPQSQPLPGQVMNSAGGYSFPVDDWTRLDRFLILGTEGGSYYAKARDLTMQNTDSVNRCIIRDGKRVVKRIVEISDAGRAPKNEPAILALALAMAYGDLDTRLAAAEALPQVCRIGTHLFHFAQYVDLMRGWGRGLRRAISRWYITRAADDLAFQAIKYQQRDGWSHRDLLRLTHALPPTEGHQAVFNWIVRGWPEGKPLGEDAPADVALRPIWAFERAKQADRATLIKLIQDHNLPREALPTEALTDPAVWEAMLPHIGLTALLRNLGNLSRIGLLVDGNRKIVNRVTDMLTDAKALRRGRIHPIAVLTALLTYGSGRSVRGSGTWTPVTKVVDALDEAFYTAFGSVEPSGKRMVLALDISGSMSWGTIAGVPGLTPRVASAAMSLITAATEAEYHVMAFGETFVPVKISPRQRLDDAVKAISDLPFAGTDCAQPMLWAMENKVQADAFVIYTDSETWFGKIHPAEALRQYREKMGIPARLTVVGMVANEFSIADPQDGGMLDVVGMDTATPQLIADFAGGRL